VPEIFNTDQGSQFTSDDFIGVLECHDIRISMDGKGRWMDNVIVERLWRSLKYVEVNLKGTNRWRRLGSRSESGSTITTSSDGTRS